MKQIDVQALTVQLDIADQPYTVVDQVSFALPHGQILGIVGESGCGKSMTAYALQGLLPSVASVTSGALFVGGDRINLGDAEHLRQLRQRDFAMIFQNPMSCLNPLLSVGRQIAEALPADVSDRRARVLHAMREVKLRDVESLYMAYPHQLSGGMRQRVMIAMALIKQPSFLIADEPTTSLDVTTEAEILELIRELVQKYQTTVIFITHDLAVVESIADQVAIMYAGQFIEYGATTTIFERPSHPYTRGLLASIPSPAHKGERLQTISGTVPSLTNRDLSCCLFSNRCTHCQVVCRQTMPANRQVDERMVKCHLAGKLNE